MKQVDNENYSDPFEYIPVILLGDILLTIFKFKIFNTHNQNIFATAFSNILRTIYSCIQLPFSVMVFFFSVSAFLTVMLIKDNSVDRKTLNGNIKLLIVSIIISLSILIISLISYHIL
ncbi:hypothetical protein IAI10_16765 [Clostridium sp. 19966]|uniref:hypothetical protein n=1 Tax=Clostridium sp. 19966 TaxID=2768166 RepID=UPI0028DE62A1|nr:hypothetical protein [Clostridium sp. 19966]MDT8718320.1 hypothetical protein [Clostridium sp. 19966]